jgi:hypothetical protein
MVDAVLDAARGDDSLQMRKGVECGGSGVGE